MSEPMMWCPECGAVAKPHARYHLRQRQDWDQRWLEKCPGTPIDLVAERERLLEWIGDASHHLGCSGGWRKGTNANAEWWDCQCGRRELLEFEEDNAIRISRELAAYMRREAERDN